MAYCSIGVRSCHLDKLGLTGWPSAVSIGSWHVLCASNGPAGRYHITARGNERKKIFRDDTDRFHFLELLSELGECFGGRVHAYVLMDNHYHLLIETPEANLS